MWLIALILCLPALLYTDHWLFACLMVGIYAFHTLTSSKKAARTPDSGTAASRPPRSEPEAGQTEWDLANLTVLRHEMGELLAEGGIDPAFHDRVQESIASLESELLDDANARRDGQYRQAARQAAWALLARWNLVPPGSPPWSGVETSDPVEFMVDPSVESTASAPEPAEFSPEGDREQSLAYAWKSHTPGALEQALRTVSGWPALAVPFLVQNIGWFIGGLCVVAGSVFLVSYTSGFLKALTGSLVLAAYTFFILWAGYQLRLRRTGLEVSSSVLLSLGVLLIPLNVAASVRLVAAAEHFSRLLIGVPAAAVLCGGLYFGVLLVSAIMDRSLRGLHPKLFFGLAAMQLAVPLLERFPSWPLLAVLHFLLLGLLAFGLVSFTRDWLHSIFIDHRKIAYYAAGTLVYAALVSFVHLTWGYASPCKLPAGYYSPFLMALCGLLFYVDAQFKQWTRQAALLSRFSFAVYGLSLLALAFSADTPTARFITLLLAVMLYAMMLRQTLTFPPLCLLLGCLGWLYGLIVLKPLPPVWHLAAGLPGLVGLIAASRELLRRGSPALALPCYRMAAAASVGLTAWSLLHARPGGPALLTALTATALFFYGLKFAPAALWGGWGTSGSSEDLREGPSFFAVTLMAGVAVAYAPLLPGADRTVQCALGLVVLAVWWAGLGLRLHHPFSPRRKARVEVLLGSALLNLGTALVLTGLLALPDLAAHRILPLLTAALGSVFLWLSLALRERGFFYFTLGLCGATGAIIKLTTFPRPGAGGILFAAGLALWALLWRLEREPDEDDRTLRREEGGSIAAGERPLTLLWLFAVHRADSIEEVLCRPLLQAMVVLGGVGTMQLAIRLVDGDIGWAWTVSSGLGGCLALLSGGRLRLSGAPALAILFGLGGWLTLWPHVFTLRSSGAGLSSVAVYALLSWGIGVFVLNHPNAPRLAKILHLGGRRTLAERSIHHLALTLALLCAGFSLADYDLFTPNLPLFLTFLTACTLLWLAGQRYRNRFHSSVLLGLCVLGTLAAAGWLAPFAPPPGPVPFPALLTAPWFGLCLAMLGLSMRALALGLERPAVESDDPARSEGDESLYRKPLRLAAVTLWLAATLWQVMRAWSDPASARSLMSIGAMASASGSLLRMGFRQAKQSPAAVWVYAVSGLLGVVGVYVRLLWIGLAPLTVWDTAALMGATTVFFIVQQWTASKPLLHVVLVMPLLALLTVPLELGSAWAAGTLVSAGVLYCLAYRTSDRSLPLYMGLLAFNAAVYLWVPHWAARARMLQVYILPAAVTVLFLLHLHRKELKPNVLNSARLWSLSVLYAAATLDVFLRGELALFALALALSLTGVLAGIAMRVRAFLYSGVAFLVLNVLGQTVLLFPEERLGKAILLLTLGVVITGGMIWFNLQREKILQRIRIFRADLETWR